jgi:hypothetical protein
LHLNLTGAQVVDPATFPRSKSTLEEFYQLRQRKGITRTEAAQLILNPTTFGSMMVRLGDADGLIGGLTTHYPDTIRPALQVIDVRPELRDRGGRLPADHAPRARSTSWRTPPSTSSLPPKSWPKSPSWPPKRRAASTRSRASPCSRSPTSAARAIRSRIRCAAPWSWCASARRAS